MAKQVRAAGGVPIRFGAGGSMEVLLVHRPHYGDWTFPKGKADPGERWKDTARREVLEETGLVCELGAKLPTVHYADRKGRPKEVRYWEMTVVSGSFVPNDEVDRVVWLPLDRARNRLTYPRDHVLVDEPAARLPV